MTIKLATSHRAISGLLLALVLLTLIPVSPLFQHVPPDDSGLFAYVGQRMLAGDVLYRDVWDQKPPGIHLVYVIGLSIGGGSFWGVWALELIAVAAAALLAYDLLATIFGRWPAVFGSVLMVLSLGFVIQSGHYPEVFALPLQIGALRLYIAYQRQEPTWWIGLLLGVTGAFAFLLRQNLIGIWAVIGLDLLLGLRAAGESRRVARLILRIVLGAAIFAIPVFSYFAVNGALADAWSAFLFNFTYSENTMLSRVLSLRNGWESLAPTGIILFAVGGWIMALITLIRGERDPAISSDVTQRMIRLAVLIFPLEVALSAISGRGYRHYFVTWLPVLAVLSAYFATWLAGMPRPDAESAPSGASGPPLVIALLVASSVLSVAMMIDSWRPLWEGLRSPQDEAVIDYILTHTAPDDPIMIWGHRSGYHFVTGRRAASRYHYYNALLDAGSIYMPELLDDLRANPPALILDMHTSVPIMDLTKSPDFAPLEPFITEHYEQAGTVGPQEWPVYRLREDNGG